MKPDTPVVVPADGLPGSPDPTYGVWPPGASAAPPGFIPVTPDVVAPPGMFPDGTLAAAAGAAGAGAGAAAGAGAGVLVDGGAGGGGAKGAGTATPGAATAVAMPATVRAEAARVVAAAETTVVIRMRCVLDSCHG